MTDRVKTVVVLKGYPRLSETFIAQEIRGLELAGFDLALVALRRPGDTKRHPVHDEIKAPVLYLPEYLHDEPWRVMGAVLVMLPRPGFWRALLAWLKDWRRDLSRNRVRRFGQAAVLSAEWPQGGRWLHSHFIHTPASVTAYASLMKNVPWTCSAHAKDIWTSPGWELSGKLAAARWVVTCTRTGYDHLVKLAHGQGHVHLSYHGLDLVRFDRFADRLQMRDGSDAGNPVIILSVGRAVAKKGYDVLLRALSLLPRKLAWRFIHVGGGEELAKLKELCGSLGLASKISWKGAMAQEEVLAHYRQADIFALACRIAADGDRDGLPNVLVEAASQNLACVSTNVSGVPELLTDQINGRVVPPEDAQALARALEHLIGDPLLRRRLGEAAEARVRKHFDHLTSIGQLTALFETEWRKNQ